MSRTLLLALGLSLAAPARAADPVTAPHFTIVGYKLANGLEVLLHQDHTVPLVNVNLWYHAGSGDEVPGKSGLAHLCEHMMFEGSKHVAAGQHFQVLGSAGNADANATTGADRTDYFETVPSHQLETVLWLESDRMSYLAGALDQGRFDNQREVVRNERRQRYENVAFAAERFAIARALYPEGHPYRNLTIGLHEDLERETLEDARAFFQKWYVPSNATLVIAGDIDVTRTRALIDKWFGTLPRVPKPAHRALTTPAVGSARRQVITDAFTQLRRIHYVWPGVKALSDEDVALDVAANVLGREATGRLYRRFVVGETAEDVGAYHVGNNFSGELHVIVDLRPQADMTEVEAQLQAEIEAMRTERVDARELRQTVADFEVGMVSGLETIDARAAQLQSFNHYRHVADSFAWKLAAVQVSPDTLRTLMRRIAGPGRVEIITVPGTKP
jgi:zinc protease